MTKLLTPQQLADWLGVKLSTIYQWTHIGYIPHVKLGKFVRFRESEIVKWIEKREVEGRTTQRLRVNMVTR